MLLVSFDVASVPLSRMPTQFAQRAACEGNQKDYSMSSPVNQDSCPSSIFHESEAGSAASIVELKLPQLQHRDEEFLLGLNEILDELNPTSDHGPLSGLGLHRYQ